MRPYVSDALLQYLQYWVDAYKAQALRNAVEKVRITRFETAKVTRDLHYDAVTLRVFATGFEVTTNAAGEVVGGSRRRERPYSEYWTLIRAGRRAWAAAARAGLPRTAPPSRSTWRARARTAACTSPPASSTGC